MMLSVKLSSRNIMMRFMMTLSALTLTQVALAQDCFTSTKRLFETQLADLQAGNEDVREYIICPDTQIDVGPPISRRLNRFLFDFPIAFVRPNITIKCGEDGSRNNNCVLNARKAVLLVGAFNNMESSFGVKDINVDGSKLQGFTLTGNFAVSRRERLPLGATPVLHNAPGTLTLEDCAFTGILTRAIISSASTSAVSPDPQPADVSTLEVKNSYFDDIEYNLFGINAREQNIKIRNSSFNNIRFVSYRRSMGNVRGIFGWSEFGGMIDVQDSCFTDIQSATGTFVEYNHDGTNGLPSGGRVTFNNSFAENLELQPYEEANDLWICREGYSYLGRNSPEEPSFLANCTNPFTAAACPSTVSTNVQAASSKSSFSSFLKMFGF